MVIDQGIKSNTKIKFILMTAVLLSLLSFCVSKKAFAAEPALSPKKPIIVVIDPGHGGENQGTTENGFEEKQMTMLTAETMYEELRKFDDVVVYMTHMDDRDLSLKDRAEFAKNVNADFLFSIHYNASVNHEIYGAEVWVSCQAPFNAYGYQFGYIHQLYMQEKGIYLRGVKTKTNDKGTDYYGILRESAARNIPAAIVEHCHVDIDNDSVFCDEEEELIAFGIADAHSVAKYFGLSSEELGIDYSEEQLAILPPLKGDASSLQVTMDETAPEICEIEKTDMDLEAGTLSIKVTAADFDSPLLYYRYSYDNGETFSPWYEYPGSNALSGSYDDTFTVTLNIPDGISPQVIVRVANLYDLYTDSNVIFIPQTFGRIKEEIPSQEIEEIDSTEQTEENIIDADASVSTDTEGFLPKDWLENHERKESQNTRFGTFMLLCLFIVILCFFFVFTFILVKRIQTKKHRRKHK